MIGLDEMMPSSSSRVQLPNVKTVIIPENPYPSTKGQQKKKKKKRNKASRNGHGADNAIEVGSSTFKKPSGISYSGPHNDNDSQASSGDHYRVEKILEHRDKPNPTTGQPEREYLVKWLHFKVEESSWEPEANFGVNNKALIEYQDKLARRPTTAEWGYTKALCEEYYKKKQQVKSQFKDPKMLMHLSFTLEELEENLTEVEKRGIRIRDYGVLGKDKIDSIQFEGTMKDPSTGKKELYFKVRWRQNPYGHRMLMETLCTHTELVKHEVHWLLRFYEQMVDFSLGDFTNGKK